MDKPYRCRKLASLRGAPTDALPCGINAVENPESRSEKG